MFVRNVIEKFVKQRANFSGILQVAPIFAKLTLL